MLIRTRPKNTKRLHQPGNKKRLPGPSWYKEKNNQRTEWSQIHNSAAEDRKQRVEKNHLQTPILVNPEHFPVTKTRIQTPNISNFCLHSKIANCNCFSKPCWNTWTPSADSWPTSRTSSSPANSNSTTKQKPKANSLSRRPWSSFRTDQPPFRVISGRWKNISNSDLMLLITLIDLFLGMRGLVLGGKF